MTVIVADLRSRTLAADTFCSAGYRSNKIFRTHAKGLFGCAGDDFLIAKFESWLLRKGKKPEFGSESAFESLQLCEGAIFIWGAALRPERILADFHAVGSGGLYALAVLKHGGTIQEALDIAAFYDGDCKPPFTMETE